MVQQRSGGGLTNAAARLSNAELFISGKTVEMVSVSATSSSGSCRNSSEKLLGLSGTFSSGKALFWLVPALVVAAPLFSITALLYTTKFRVVRKASRAIMSSTPVNRKMDFMVDGFNKKALCRANLRNAFHNAQLSVG